MPIYGSVNVRDVSGPNSMRSGVTEVRLTSAIPDGI